MLRPERMSRVRILGMRKSMPSVIRSLHQAGVLEIREMDPSKIERDMPLPDYEGISGQLVRMRGLAAQLKQTPVGKSEKPLALREAMRLAGTLKIEPELGALKRGIEDARAELLQITALASQIRGIEPLDVDFSKLESGFLEFRAGTVAKKDAKGLLLRLAGADATVAQAPGGKGRVALLIAVGKGADITAPLEGAKFSEVPIGGIRGTPKKALAELAYRMEKVLREQARLDGILAEMSEAFYGQVAAIEEALKIEADRAEITSRFGKTEQAFAIEGWVPKSEERALKAMLEAKFPKSVSVLDAPDDGTAPTRLQNPGIARPFEAFMGLFSLPKYSEIDPTFILTFTIPILYGLIVGDALYGLISLGLSHLMVSRSKPGSMMHDFGKIWLYGAIPTILFGIAFDEYAGFTHEHLLGTKLYSGFHRMEGLSGLMLATLFIGMLHLAIGFFIGFLNERGHNTAHAIAKLAWIGVMAGGSVAVAALMFNAVPQLWGLGGLGLLAICAFLIFRAEGIVGLIEIPSLGGNIMSYLRIAAVGLVGVILAEAINGLVPKAPPPTLEGIAMFAFASLAYAGLHVGHTMLAMFEGLIQGGRLNVVEFFGKFYSGNGARYSPFSYVRKYTQDG